MKLIRLLKHDISEGIGKRYIYLILPVILSFFSCVGIHFSLDDYRALNKNIGSGTVMDYWIYLVQGSNPYKFDVYSFFEIPTAWVSLYLFLLVCLNNYPIRDLEQWGYQVILSSRSRRNWWLSKILWIVCYVAVYMAVCFLVVSVYACANGASLSLHASPQIMERMAKRGFASCPMLHRVFINLVLPSLFMVFLGILQLLLSVKIPSIHAFVVLFVVLVVSTYKRNWLLIGNWAMPCRIYPIASGGLNPKLCALLCAGGILAGTAVGYLMFRKKDIFEKLV